MKKIIQNKKEKINKTKQIEKARQKKHYFLLRKDWAKEKRLFRSASPIQFRINIISCYACMIKSAYFGENNNFLRNFLFVFLVLSFSFLETYFFQLNIVEIVSRLIILQLIFKLKI